MSNRANYVSLATASYRELSIVINSLTENELREALTLESQTTRRATMMQRMIGRLVRLNEIEYKAKLEKEYSNGTISICNNEPGR